MERYLEDLIARVPVKAAEFAQRLQAAVPSIICDVGASSNSAFLFRSFVSVRADNNGDELAVTVDITRPKNGTISIESDICMDDGSVIAAGPAAQFSLLDENSVPAPRHLPGVMLSTISCKPRKRLSCTSFRK